MIIRPCLFLFSELFIRPILTSTPTRRPLSTIFGNPIPRRIASESRRPTGGRTKSPASTTDYVRSVRRLLRPKPTFFRARSESSSQLATLPKTLSGTGSPLHRLNQPARPKTNTTQELTCSYFCALPASVPPSLARPSAPPDLPQQHAWQPPSLRSTAAAEAINLAGQVL